MLCCCVVLCFVLCWLCVLCVVLLCCCIVLCCVLCCVMCSLQPILSNIFVGVLTQQIPQDFCVAFFCPPCVAFVQRREILEHDMSQYQCCGGMYLCLCVWHITCECGISHVSVMMIKMFPLSLHFFNSGMCCSCHPPCPNLCLALESCLCFACAVCHHRCY